MRAFSLRRVGIVAAIVCATVPGGASAQGGSRDDEARALFEAGEVAFADGRYENALESFQRAYELSARPALLYNIGVAAQQAGHEERAIDAYRAYLEQATEPPNRNAVESRIAMLEREVAERDAPRPEDEVGDQDRATAPTQPRGATGAEQGGANTGAIILIAASAAVAVGGGVMLGIGLADQASVENVAMDARWESIRGAYERAPILQTIGWVCAGVGVAGAIAGVIWIVSGGSDETAVTVSPAGVAVRGRF